MTEAKDEPGESDLETVAPGHAKPGEDQEGVADKGNPTDPANPTG
jgi:hypothetical protein